MTWLDERLFGWSRSTRRGTSAWGGGTPMTELSRAATPDASDSEEGDYEHVISYLGSYTGDNASYRTRSRSLKGSYADLHLLKTKDSVGNSADSTKPELKNANSPALRFRATGNDLGSDPFQNGHREAPRARKSSLTDRVPVEKIGNLTSTDSFQTSTSILNKEIKKD